MPYKDPEAQREAQRDLMRRRREALKSRESGESGINAASPILNELPLAESHSQGELSSLVPPFIDAENAHLVDWGANPEVRQLVNRWHRFKNQTGFPCCKSPGGDCCFPLIDQERKLARPVTDCVFQPEVCPYHRGGNGDN